MDLLSPFLIVGLEILLEEEILDKISVRISLYLLLSFLFQHIIILSILAKNDTESVSPQVGTIGS